MFENHEPQTLLEHLRVVLLSLMVVSPAILPGLTYGYSAIALPELKLSLRAASWFGCFSNIGCFFGALLSGFIIDKYGRKPCFIFSIIPSIIGWFLLSTDFTPVIGYMGRFLTGLSTGSTTYASSVYLSECIVRHRLNLRSGFATWSSVAITFGICIVDILGLFLRCDEVAVIFTILSVVLVLLIVIFIPESPIWLYHKGRTGDAEWAMKRLRLPTLIPDADIFNDIILKPNKQNVLQLLCRKDVYKPLLITTTLLSFGMLSGGMILITYMVDIIKTTTMSYSSSYYYNVISGILQLVISASVTFILPHTGNRKLTMISGIGMIIGMSLLGYTAMWQNIRYQHLIDLIHTFAVMFCIIMFSFGFLTIPGALLGELFPVEAQGFASIPCLVSFAVNILVTKVHLYLFTFYGGIIYYGYAIMNILGTLAVYFLMPETVGRTLEDIRSDFS